MEEPVVPNPSNDSQSLNGLSFAALSGPHDQQLWRSLTVLGADVSLLEAHSLIDQQRQNQLAKRLTSDFANRLLTGEIDFVVFLTGAGFRYLVEQASRQVDRNRFLSTLSDIVTIAGSANAVAAMRELEIKPEISIERPVSWRDILIAIDRQIRITNFQVGLEESDAVQGLSSGLEARGGRVIRFPVHPQIPPTYPKQVIQFFERIEAQDVQVMLFTSPADVARFCYLAKNFGRAKSVAHCLDYQIIVALGQPTCELLKDHQIPVDYTVPSKSLELSITEIAAQMAELKRQKQIIMTHLSGPGTSISDTNAPWYDNPFMKACRGEPTDVTPIWMMRQAGRYMAEYREIRDKVGFLELCSNPQLCSEVMCTAVNRLGVDAAIIFSDLLPILVPMGMQLEFTKGDGPVIHNPIQSAGDVDRVRRLEDTGELSFVMETVTQTRNDLPEDIPLIGFAGSPFTLASYMIEGGSSRNYARTKQLMFTESSAWKELMLTLSHSIAIYLKGQIAAGAQCVQLFDSWAGVLAYEDYKQFAYPYVKQIIDSLPGHVPVINFATGNPSLLPLLADSRAAVIGIDWRIRLDEAWETIGFERSVQGNLDPTVLLTNPQEIKRQAKFILDLAGGRPGHIFNLGHGILPQTPVENAIALVDIVHELSQR